MKLEDAGYDKFESKPKGSIFKSAIVSYATALQASIRQLSGGGETTQLGQVFENIGGPALSLADRTDSYR